ncbi:MAG: hypothetical protein F6J90_19190 [Moorea sp. SIOASIH]|uniref:hypothetical protein n=1 Tax=Moorena sp. SIOASIH TaxID=2607817 RepID=UPI0013BE3FFC|nr:hypothetical protein [Moorena sp. SIOASIH]NEO38342.1 hypothetical protein [Moorena sp. SIOASIH]
MTQNVVNNQELHRCISLLLFDPVGGTGILVERASWWNGHLGGTGILVERASCPFHSQTGCPNKA